MKKVAIIYGWAEGHWHGKKLRQALHKAGFSVIKDAEDADIIIAHSGGCFMIPAKTRANTLMLVGLPYWPGKHPRLSLREKVRAEVKDKRWFIKTIYNAFYMVTRPQRWYRMWQAWRSFSIPASSKNTAIVAIRNKNDHFMHPTAFAALAKEQGWHHQVFPGLHDDLWLNPEPYVRHLRQTK